MEEELPKKWRILQTIGVQVSIGTGTALFFLNKVFDQFIPLTMLSYMNMVIVPILIISTGLAGSKAPDIIKKIMKNNEND